MTDEFFEEDGPREKGSARSKTQDKNMFEHIGGAAATAVHRLKPQKPDESYFRREKEAWTLPELSLIHI